MVIRRQPGHVDKWAKKYGIKIDVVRSDYVERSTVHRRAIRRLHQTNMDARPSRCRGSTAPRFVSDFSMARRLVLRVKAKSPRLNAGVNLSSCRSPITCCPG